MGYSLSRSRTLRLLEERQDALRTRVGDGQCLHAQLLQGAAERIGTGLQIGKAVGTRRSTAAVLNDGDAPSGIGLLGPAPATDLRHVEVLGHLPAKALVHAGVK